MASDKKKSIMKTSLVTGLVLVCVLCCGCEETIEREPIDKSLVNTELINTLNDIAMENALIAQRTLYPYHFVEGGEKLNELGQRDLAIMSNHFREQPGQLNLRRDDTPENLYQARLAYVSEQLQQSGIDLTQVTIVDGMPGGSGMTSSDVLQIREADQKVRDSRRKRVPRFDERR